MKSIKEKFAEARDSTRVAVVGGAVFIAGTWGSCQLQYSEHSEQDRVSKQAESQNAPVEADPEQASKVEAE